MTRIVTVVCVLLFLADVLAEGKDRTEYINWTIEKTWKVANASEIPKVYRIWEYIREGDDLQNWKELVTLQNFSKSRSFHSPEATLNELMATREKECPGATEWKVIEKQADSILYEWRAKVCLGQPEQSEIARIVFGKHNVFVLHYAAKVPGLAPETRALWIDLLRGATIKVGQ